eukprot:5995239-Prymnesium_polylepis.1
MSALYSERGQGRKLRRGRRRTRAPRLFSLVAQPYGDVTRDTGEDDPKRRRCAVSARDMSAQSVRGGVPAAECAARGS